MEEESPRDGGVVGEGAEGPGRSERAPIASGGGMRRSEEARVSEEAVRRKGGAESLRQVRRAQGEVRKPKCRRKED